MATDNNTLARPYAEAAFDVARTDGTLAGWGASLEIARELLADGRVADFLGNPSLTEARQLVFLAGLFAEAGASLFAGQDRKGTNFLKLLLEYDRIAVLPEIAAHFDALKDAVENTIDVTVRAATELSERERGDFVRALEKRFGRRVEITTEVDEHLIGGAVIRAGDVVIDGSLRARLEGLTNALVN